MPQTLRHPRYPGALTKDEVKPGVPFKWFGHDTHNQTFVTTATFRSHVQVDEGGEGESYAVIQIDGQPSVVEKSLITLGILPDSEGNWHDCVCVSTENDMSDD